MLSHTEFSILSSQIMMAGSSRSVSSPPIELLSFSVNSTGKKGPILRLIRLNLPYPVSITNFKLTAGSSYFKVVGDELGRTCLAMEKVTKKIKFFLQ